MGLKVQLATIASRSGTGPAQQLMDEYLRRTRPFFQVDAPVFRSEEALLAAVERAKGRTAPVFVLLDREGVQLSSEGLARLVDRHRALGTQLLVLAVGPADGWSAGLRASGCEMLSLGPMTLPHELARVVLAEQVYRAATILAGHPYHAGH